MSNYGWIVERDILESKDVEIFGPSDIDDNTLKLLRAGYGEKFRMYDDDNELYFEGRIIPNKLESDWEFAPLDDFGAPDSGATSIAYLTDDKWVEL